MCVIIQYLNKIICYSYIGYLVANAYKRYGM